MARQTNLLPMALAGGERRTRTEPSKYDDLAQSMMMQQAFKPEPIHSVGHGLTKMGQMALMGYLEGKRGRDEKRERERMAEALFGTGGGNSGNSGKAKSSASKLGSVLGGEKLEPEGGFVERVVSVESGGDPNAKNPRSSATGPGQFIESTWLDMIRENRPELAQGQSREDLLALRSDPNLSREMTNAYGDQNAQFLESRGLPVNDATKYLAHFAGPGGAADVLSADPATPVGSVLGNQVVQANPFLADMTAGDLVGWAGNKMGSGGAQQPQQPPIEPAGGSVPQQPNVAPAASQPRQTGNQFIGSPGDRVLQMRGMATGGGGQPQPQPAMGQPPAPQPQAIAPGQQAQAMPQPQGQTTPQQPQQGAPEEQQPGWMAQYLEPQEMQALRQAYMSGNISDMDVLQYVNQKRAAMQGPKPTGTMQEYEAARQQGYQGSLFDYQRDLKQAGGQTINVGPHGEQLPDPEKGYVYARDEQGNTIFEPHPETGYLRPVQVPVGHGSVERERQAAQQQQAGKTERQENLGTVVVQDMDEMYDRVQKYGDDGLSDFLRDQLKGVAGTSAYNDNELIEATRATISLQNLQELKETTGAGLGNVSDRQSELLASAYGSIKIGQSKEQLLDAIARTRNIYLDIIYGRGRGPERLPFRGKPWKPLAGSEWVDDQGTPIPWDEVDRQLGPPEQSQGQTGQGNGKPPPGVDPEDWKYMTPEQRALWQ